MKGGQSIHQQISPIPIEFFSSGKVFTFRALDNRIEIFFEDPNEKEYSKRNLENILKELTSKGSIKSVQSKDVTHYFFQKVQRKPNGR